MRHQDNCSETQEAQAVGVHPNYPERGTGRNKKWKSGAHSEYEIH